MWITAYSYSLGKQKEFYCYLKTATGKIAESVGKNFSHALLKALIKLWRRK